MIDIQSPTGDPMKEKLYKAKSISGAEREVRRLRKSFKHFVDLFEEAHKDRVILAKLAAEGPCFFDPLTVIKAKRRRDELLRTFCNLGSAGQFLKG